MDVVYSVPNAEKSKAMAVIENDKFGENAFATRGFVVKDGTDFALAGRTLIIVRNIGDEFKRLAMDKLKGVQGLEAVNEEKTKEIVKKVNEEEEAAQGGFGSIFG